MSEAGRCGSCQRRNKHVKCVYIYHVYMYIIVVFVLYI